MVDDLTVQSGDGGRRKRLRSLHISPLSFLTGLVGLTVLGLSGYLLLVDDPLGGEPVTRVPIEKAADRDGDADRAGGTETAMSAMRPTVDAEQTDGGSPDDGLPVGDIVIRDPATLSVAGDVLAPVAAIVPELTEPSRHGLLPKMGPDGVRPAQAYSRAAPVFGAEASRIAVIVTGMGLSTTMTEQAIGDLPGNVTLAFAPYGREVGRLAARARQDGHEIMLQVPLEPYDYPDNDPGPHTLLAGLSEEQNRDRLHWVMSRFGGYVGLTNYMGARFTASDKTLRPVLGELRERGLVYIDDGSSLRSVAAEVARDIGLPLAAADIVIDAEPTRETIREALARLERLALDNGLAVGIATGLPASIEEIASWSRRLQAAGISLVPVTVATTGGEI